MASPLRGFIFESLKEFNGTYPTSCQMFLDFGCPVLEFPLYHSFSSRLIYWKTFLGVFKFAYLLTNCESFNFCFQCYMLITEHVYYLAYSNIHQYKCEVGEFQPRFTFSVCNWFDKRCFSLAIIGTPLPELKALRFTTELFLRFIK